MSYTLDETETGLWGRKSGEGGLTAPAPESLKQHRIASSFLDSPSIPLTDVLSFREIQVGVFAAVCLGSNNPDEDHCWVVEERRHCWWRLVAGDADVEGLPNGPKNSLRCLELLKTAPCPLQRRLPSDVSTKCQKLYANSVRGLLACELTVDKMMDGW